MRSLLLPFAVVATATPLVDFYCKDDHSALYFSCFIPPSVNIQGDLTEILSRKNFEAYAFHNKLDPGHPLMSVSRSRKDGTLMLSVNSSDAEFAYLTFSDAKKPIMLHLARETCRCASDRQSMECSASAFNVSFVPSEECAGSAEFFDFLKMAIHKAHVYANKTSPTIVARAEPELSGERLPFPFNILFNLLAPFKEWVVGESPHPFVICLMMLGVIALAYYVIYVIKHISARRRLNEKKKLF
ncbi:MAG: hypothetical protein ABW189_01710 [Rickettsiales bacterium]